MKLPIRWDRMAKESLDQIYEFIFQDSHLNARKVKKRTYKISRILKRFSRGIFKGRVFERITWKLPLGKQVEL